MNIYIENILLKCLFSLAVGGASFADIGEALEEILSSSMVHLTDVETEELQSHKDAVISCCWLHIKVRHSKFLCVK